MDSHKRKHIQSTRLEQGRTQIYVKFGYGTGLLIYIPPLKYSIIY